MKLQTYAHLQEGAIPSSPCAELGTSTPMPPLPTSGPGHPGTPGAPELSVSLLPILCIPEIVHFLNKFTRAKLEFDSIQRRPYGCALE